MKIVTWNVNSIRTRLDQVLDWMEANDPDVVCMQETKIADQEFPVDEFGDLGYDVHTYGNGGYCGVAIACKDEARQISPGLPEEGEDQQRRVVALEVMGVRVVNVYAPNGQDLRSDKYEYKLEWYARLHRYLQSTLKLGQPLVLTGDFNICPLDIDVGDPGVDEIFRSPKERAAYQAVIDLGLTDAYRHLHPDTAQYTWWDYRRNMFARKQGLRIDHFLVSKPLVSRIESVTVEMDVRSGEQPSDHAPVVLTLSD